MKQKLLLLILLLDMQFPLVVGAETLLTKADALAIAVRQFKGKDVDYYICLLYTSPSPRDA